MHALQHLEGHLQEGMSALDVGSGSGYLAACMAYMVSNKSSLTYSLIEKIVVLKLHVSFSFKNT